MSAVAEGYRDLAEMFERVGDQLPPPYHNGNEVWLTFFGYNGTDPAAEVRRVAHLIGGRWHKNDPSKNQFDADNYTLTHDHEFGPFKLVLLAKREQVCVRVQVGTKVVETPAREAKSETVAVYEWECVPLLAKVGELDASVPELEVAS